MRPSTSSERQPEPTGAEAKDTDIEGAPTEVTIADLMKHARHDGQGMVRSTDLPMKQLAFCLCNCSVREMTGATTSVERVSRTVQVRVHAHALLSH